MLLYKQFLLGVSLCFSWIMAGDRIGVPPTLLNKRSPKHRLERNEAYAQRYYKKLEKIDLGSQLWICYCRKYVDKKVFIDLLRSVQ